MTDVSPSTDPVPDPASPQHTGVPGVGRRSRGQHAGHSHRTALRVLRIAVVAVVALALVGVGGGGYALYRLQGNIDAQDVTGLLGDRPGDEATQDPTTGNDAVNLLLMGSDTRELSDGTGGAYGGAEADPGARSDTTVLVHLSADRRSATVVSIPRDSMVQIPSCTLADGTTTEAQLGMFNAAFSEGGAACTIKTVETLTGVLVDHYAVIDFSGFRQMIDALGGVTICTPEDISDEAANLYLDAGTHTVDGETALAYARVRHIGDGSDISRINRQQALMASIIQEVTSSGMLLRPDRLYGFLDAATTSVTADSGLASLSQLLSLAQSLQKLPADGVQFLTVPIEEYPRDRNRVQWTAAAADLWTQIRTDTAGPEPAVAAGPTADPADSSALTVAPADVAVQVLNVGAPVGTAAKTAGDLAAVGFTVVGTGDGAASVAGAPVVVRYGSVGADAARTVAAALGGTTAGVVLQQDASSGSTVVVEVTSAPTVTDVRARVTATVATPTPSATTTTRVATDDICA